MLRAERPRSLGTFGSSTRSEASPRDVLLAVAPPPKTPSYPLSGWPEWLIPAYRSGAHRPIVQFLEEER
jgi:hypothetical protein